MALSLAAVSVCSAQLRAPSTRSQGGAGAALMAAPAVNAFPVRVAPPGGSMAALTLSPLGAPESQAMLPAIAPEAAWAPAAAAAAQGLMAQAQTDIAPARDPAAAATAVLSPQGLARLSAISPALRVLGAEASPNPSGRLSLGQALSMARAAFDGARESSARELPPYVTAADPGHRAALGAVLAQAKKSRSARQVLRKVEDLARRRERPVVVEFSSLSDAYGYVRSDWDILRLSSKYKRSKEAARGAVVLIHELRHILQGPDKLPLKIVEIELEAYLDTIKVARELGVKFEHGDFPSAVAAKFRRDLGKFVRWLQKAHEDAIRLSEGRAALDRLIERLEKDIGAAEKRIRRLRRYIRARRATYKVMKRDGYLAQALDAYRTDEIEATRDVIRYEERDLAESRQALQMLRTPEGERNALGFARGVMRRARRLHADLLK